MFPKPLTSPTEIEQLQEEGAVSRLTYVGDAITLTRHKIEGKVPLIGFTGAPVSYLLQVLGLYILIIIHHRLFLSTSLLGICFFTLVLINPILCQSHSYCLVLSY